jgi:hypothetical protein
MSNQTRVLSYLVLEGLIRQQLCRAGIPVVNMRKNVKNFSHILPLQLIFRRVRRIVKSDY